jgi:hypothetical protein
MPQGLVNQALGIGLRPRATLASRHSGQTTRRSAGIRACAPRCGASAARSPAAAASRAAAAPPWPAPSRIAPWPRSGGSRSPSGGSLPWLRRPPGGRCCTGPMRVMPSGVSPSSASSSSVAGAGRAGMACRLSTAATASALSRKCSVCVRQRFCLHGKARSRITSPCHHGGGALDAVLQLAHVARPVAAGQHLHGLGREGQVALVFLVEAVQKAPPAAECRRAARAAAAAKMLTTLMR